LSAALVSAAVSVIAAMTVRDCADALDGAVVIRDGIRPTEVRN
jgi:hypothetical protein